MTELNGRSIPTNLPAASQIHRVQFVAEPAEGQKVLADLPHALGRKAVVRSDGDVVEADDELLVLVVPSGSDDPDLIARVREWADSVQGGSGQGAHFITLQGAQVVWTRTRLAVVAAPDRLESVRREAVENAFYDAEMRTMEKELAESWPSLEADTPLAFEFAEKTVRHRKRLAGQFRRVLMLRARLARLTPHALAPHSYPPTLASQLGERLRERGRMGHRVESLSVQLEVFERVYEGCGQKASEFMVARTGHTLEWVIILLLFTQTVLLVVERLGVGK